MTAGPNRAGCAVLNIDGRPYGDLSRLTERKQCIECCYFHQADHVGGRVNRRQSLIVMMQRVLMGDRLFSLAPYAGRDVFRHAYNLSKPNIWLAFIVSL